MRALVVGYGRMGGFHRRALLDLGYDVSTVDPNPDMGADFDTLEEAGRLYDVACVAVPVDALAETAARLNGIPMLVEKPFARNYAEAANLANDLAGSPACVGFIERFNPHVRALRTWIRGLHVTAARFTRWSDRPAHGDVALDLTIHDVDLARFLGVAGVATYDTRVEQERKVRRIEVDHVDGKGELRWLGADFVDHVQSPIHALWHTFLMGGSYPRPDDALEAHRALEALREREVVS